MNEQYLILHKVRGEPSFDCAIKMHCPLCTSETSPCADCTCDEGYWWITNSGYRAYPYWNMPVKLLIATAGEATMTNDMPTDWPDHFEVRKEGPRPTINLGQLMAMVIKPLKRRI